MFKVENIEVTEHSILNENNELTEIVKIMKKHGTEDPLSLLPQKPWHEVKFQLKNSYSAFANGIRRTLIEEMPVKCMTFDEKDMQTDDEFILNDMLLKNVNLIPINQDLDMEKFAGYSIYLYVNNTTNDIIDVKASDIKIVVDTKHQKDKKRINLESLIPESNITLIRLRPGKYIKLIKITLEEGYGKHNAAKFTLLDSVKYKPINVEPYDPFTRVGQRSIEYDPVDFELSFTTTGNIRLTTVVELCCGGLRARLEKAKERLSVYMASDTTKKYYYASGLEVKISDAMNEYKFSDEYITMAWMLAQRCFLLDPNVLFCTPAIERYDNEFAIVKLKHADANKLLMKSIEASISDLNTLEKSLLQEIKKN